MLNVHHFHGSIFGVEEQLVAAHESCSRVEPLSKEGEAVLLMVTKNKQFLILSLVQDPSVFRLGLWLCTLQAHSGNFCLTERNQNQNQNYRNCSIVRSHGRMQETTGVWFSQAFWVIPARTTA